MASVDWTALTGSIDNAVVRSGVTSGITPPPGGGSFVYGFNSRSTPAVAGARAFKYITDVNFDPIPSNFGGQITGAVIRLPSGGTTGFSPFLFFSEQANDATGTGYMVGLQDDEPSAIVIVKGPLSLGLPAGLAGENGILRKSSESVNADTWVHLRLDVIVQGTGDVLLQAYKNDSGDVTTPVWSTIEGMDQFIDDSLGINTGTDPLTGGRCGFGMQASDVSRKGAIDHVTIQRQL